MGIFQTFDENGESRWLSVGSRPLAFLGLPAFKSEPVVSYTVYILRPENGRDATTGEMGGYYGPGNLPRRRVDWSGTSSIPPSHVIPSMTVRARPRGKHQGL